MDYDASGREREIVIDNYVTFAEVVKSVSHNSDAFLRKREEI